jgi:hypothetical protein
MMHISIATDRRPDVDVEGGAAWRAILATWAADDALRMPLVRRRRRVAAMIAARWRWRTVPSFVAGHG